MSRRPLALAAAVVLVAALLLLPGCGGSDKPKSPAGGATGEALSYFPAKAGLVALVETDPNGAQIKAAESLLNRFPGSGGLLSKLKAEIEKTGVDFDRDLKPLLGNDLAVGTAGPGGLDSMLIALVANDEGKLKALVERQIKAGKLKKIGEHAGATLYQDGPTTVVAVRGATAVIADTAAVVTAALDRHEDGKGFTLAAFDKPFEGLPEGGLVRIAGNAPTLLAGSSAASARRVPWVAALGAFAVSLRAEADAGTLDARIDTSQGDLTADDLPIAPGSDAPPLAGDGPIRVALRDPRHLIDFVQRAAQAVSPASFAAFAAGKAAIDLRFGVNLDKDVIGQLTGEAQLSTDLHEFQLRVGLKDGDAFRATLKRLLPILPDFLSGAGLSGISVEEFPRGAYGLTKDGKLVAAFSVIGDQLVVVNSGLADLERFARAPEKPVEGARGALTASVSGDTIAKALGKALGLGELSGVVLAAIDDATGWIEVTPAELRAHATLKIG